MPWERGWRPENQGSSGNIELSGRPQPAAAPHGEHAAAASFRERERPVSKRRHVVRHADLGELIKATTASACSPRTADPEAGGTRPSWIPKKGPPGSVGSDPSLCVKQKPLKPGDEVDRAGGLPWAQSLERG